MARITWKWPADDDLPTTPLVDEDYWPNPGWAATVWANRPAFVGTSDDDLPRVQFLDEDFWVDPSWRPSVWNNLPAFTDPEEILVWTIPDDSEMWTNPGWRPTTWNNLPAFTDQEELPAGALHIGLNGSEEYWINPCQTQDLRNVTTTWS